MFNRKNHDDYDNEALALNIGGIAAGLLLGAAIGATIMLFTAPYSGRKTRALLRHKAIELRERADDLVEDTRERADETLQQARARTRQLTKEARAAAKDLQKQGLDMVEKQKERVESVLENGQKAFAGVRH